MGCLDRSLAITDHARQRLKERRITLADIESALQNCLRHDAGDHGNIVHVGAVRRGTLSLNPPLGWGCWVLGVRGSASLTWENGRVQERPLARVRRHFL